MNTLDSAEEPCFLELEEYHMSDSEARRTVIAALQYDGVKSPAGEWERGTFQVDLAIGVQHISFKKLISTARETGIVTHIQNRIDFADEFFGGTTGISTPTMGFAQVTVEYAGYKKELIPPMSHYPAERELAEDIMFYREEACLFSNEYDFVFCTRYYRAYLLSCISLVDAFINRHIHMYKFADCEKGK